MPNVVSAVQKVLQVDPDLCKDDFGALTEARRISTPSEGTDTGWCRCFITRSA